MKVFKPFQQFQNLRNAIFLAGPSPRTDKQYINDCEWREQAIRLFREKGFEGDIIDPINRKFNETDLFTQTKWQREGLFKSSLIFFWIPRSEEHPAFTTNVQFGDWLHNSSIVLGYPKDSIKNDYLGIRYEIQHGRKPFRDLQSMVDWAINYLQYRKQTYFFTSDTHFSAQRTLALSARPFRNVEDMDLHLISNWNKTVTMNDVVFHLGDFGNQNVIRQLNFKRMYFIMGNYERRNKNVEILEQDERVLVLRNKSKHFFQDPQTFEIYNLVHEPNKNLQLFDEISENTDDFYLYGHIHRLQMVKRNGINVGIDCNRFTPMSFDEVRFLKNGIINHFDENVFSEIVKE